MSPPPSTPAAADAGRETLLRHFTAAGQWDRALLVAGEMLGSDPENTDAHYAAAQALISLERHAEAKPHLDRYLRSRPDSAAAHHLYGIVHFRTGASSLADEHIHRAITLEPRHFGHWYLLASHRFQQGAFAAAREHARRALELNPHNADILSLLGACQEDKSDAQAKLYLRGLELNPESSVLHNNLGAYYLDHGRPAEAEACFRRALALEPKMKVARQNLFRTLRGRDPLYRVLQFPQVALAALSSRKGAGAVLARVVLWRILLLPIIGWVVFVFPLVKAYEYLTISDIHAKAGVLGARKGGWLGFRGWPFAVRFGLFVLLTALFWSTPYLLVRNGVIDSDSLGAAVVFLAVFGFLIFQFKRACRGWWSRRQAAAGERRFRKKVQPHLGETQRRPSSPPPLPR